eukprot:41819_1
MSVIIGLVSELIDIFCNDNMDPAVQVLLDDGFTMQEALIAIKLSNNDSKDNEKYECICGCYLVKTQSCVVYNGKAVFCDECDDSKSISGIVWHCDKNNSHIAGFDVCNDCINSFDPKHPVKPPMTRSVANVIDAFQNGMRIRKNDLRSLKHHIKQIYIAGQQKPIDMQSIIIDKTVNSSVFISSFGSRMDILIVFNEFIALKSITVYTLKKSEKDVIDRSTPNKIAVYKINNNSDWDEIKSMDPDIEVHQIHNAFVIDNVSQNNPQFGHVCSMAICIESQKKDSNNIGINGIELEGTEQQCNKDYNSTIRFLKYFAKDKTEEKIQPGPLPVLAGKSGDNITEYKQTDDSINLTQKIFDELFTECKNYQDLSWDFSTSRYISSSHYGYATEQQCRLSECSCILRLQKQLKVYHTFVDQVCKRDVNRPQSLQLDYHQSLNTHVVKPAISARINNYDNVSILNDFHHLLYVHPHQFEDIYDILNDFITNNDHCDLVHCLMLRRNNRNNNINNYDNDTDLNKYEIKSIHIDSNNVIKVIE